MKTIYCTATSLDGYIADKNNSLDWLMQFGEPGDSFQKFYDQVGAIAMGSTTYEWMLENLINSPTNPGPWPYKVPAVVFTTRNLTPVLGADIQFVKGEVAPVHKKLVEAAKGKNVWIVGGGELAAKFYDQGLLDQIIVHLSSITLAGGSPLFPRQMKKPMKLTHFEKMQEGLIEIHYEIPKD